jgi:NAD(P)-dependent dehydrogenase (short-subunit alcohol dehydrogenase family)
MSEGTAQGVAQGMAKGRTALVTGASRGIGAAIARRLAAEGAAVAIVARSLDAHPHLPGTLLETAAAIRDAGGTAVPIQADLTDPGQYAGIVARASEALGPIDILVNNAAAAFYMPFERFSTKRFEVAIAINVHAPFALSQLVLPAMRARRRGWILNVSSATAVHPNGPPYADFHVRGGAIVYGLTKAALERFTTGLAAETAADGIAVNALAPVAAVRTPGTDALGVVPEDRPELLEPMEVMVEAALALCTVEPATLTGRLAYSRPLLEELGRAPRTLDGRYPLQVA